MKFSNLISAITCALAFALLLPPSLMAQSVSKLKLEHSTDMQTWQTVPMTPEMIDANGELVLQSNSAQQFFRMRVSVLQLPIFTSQPASSTAIEEEESTTLSVNVTGEGLSYQWYSGQTGDTTQPIAGANSASYITGALTDDAVFWVRVTNAAGIKDSGTLAVTINRPPTITTQPISQTIVSGSTATMTVEVSGTAPFTYQWYRGNVGSTTAPIGTNSASFTTPTLTATTRYWVKVSNGSGEVSSSSCIITIGVAPSITTQPVSTTINSGSTATLSVVAGGSTPLTYQWYQGAVGTTTSPVGTNSASFTTSTLTATTTYWVRVSTAAGNINSNSATVTVNPVAPSITTQPASTSTNSGSTASLTITATGTAPIIYQWYQGPVGTTTSPVGTNSASFTTATLTATTTYWVRVSNAAGNINSTSAMVTVVVVTTPVDMALIPGGSFTMGDSLDGDADATPVTVSVSAFFVGKNEVTKASWDDVRTWGEANGYTDLRAGAGKAENHPVQTVSWWDVVKWCNARSQMDGLVPVYTTSGTVMKTGTTAPTVNWSANGYRLPTEAEWEKAARGGVSGKRFTWGTNTISHSQANYHAWSSGDLYDLSRLVNTSHPMYSTGSFPYTSPVGTFAANGFGLHDMAGNVKEWCWDWYGPYSNGTSDPRGAASGTTRVFRGGSWGGPAYACRVDYRSSSGEVGPTRTSDNIGFRVVRSSVP
jgi:formylglycine-generating enzyme required for sulfatase activity